MNHLLKKGLLMVALVSVGVQAQFYQSNARMTALGGTYIMDDMTDLLRYPVYMNTYKNSIQATFNSPIMGVMSVGDMMSIGVVANKNFVLDNSADGFYTTGNAFLGGAAATQKVPHLLLGFNLDAVSLGFDLFYEYASSHATSETKASPSVTTEVSRASRNPGVIASAIVGSEDIPIAAKVGISFPSISGKTDNGTTTTELKSDKGLFFEAGVEATLPVADFALTLGTDLNFESYAYARDTADSDTIYGKSRLAFFAGLEGEVLTTAKWGALVTVSRSNTKKTSATDTAGSPLLTVSFSGGIENAWTNVWKFDECFARGGLTFTTTTPGASSDNTTDITKTTFQTTYGTVTPSVGAGVKKGAFQLDITIHPTAWSGLVSGPAVGVVTGTFTF